MKVSTTIRLPLFLHSPTGLLQPCSSELPTKYKDYDIFPKPEIKLLTLKLKSQTVKPASKQVWRFRVLFTWLRVVTIDAINNFLLYLRNREIWVSNRRHLFGKQGYFAIYIVTYSVLYISPQSPGDLTLSKSKLHFFHINSTFKIKLLHLVHVSIDKSLFWYSVSVD